MIKLKDNFTWLIKILLQWKKFVDIDIAKNKVEWFSFYGMNNYFWHSHGLEFSLIKEYNKKHIKIGLEAWR